MFSGTQGARIQLMCNTAAEKPVPFEQEVTTSISVGVAPLSSALLTEQPVSRLRHLLAPGL